MSGAREGVDMSLGLGPLHGDGRAAVRLWAFSWVLATLVPVAACSGQSPVSSGAAPSVAVPTEVHCADVAQLRQRAADDRSWSTTLKGDQERVTTGNRANFLSSLALIADLKCKVTVVNAEEALRPALDAARNAEAAGGFYEAAHLWNQATFNANQVAAVLTQQLALPSSR